MSKQTEIQWGEEPVIVTEKWKECKLGDIITLHYGKALKSEHRKDGKIPVYSSAGIAGYHDEPLVSSEGLIIGRKGTLGNVYYSDKPFFCIDTAYFILPDEEKYHFKFLFYLLQTLGFEELNEDSAVPGLNRNTAYDQDILLPSLSEQRAITAVLSSLDDKINFLHRQNATLEALAATLFRQWFVEEAKDEWEERKVGDIADHLKVGINPVANPTVVYSQYSLPAYDNGQVPTKELGLEILSNKYEVIPNTILISKLNPRFPRIWAIGGTVADNSVCSTEFQVFKPKRQSLYAYFYFLVKSEDVVGEMTMAASGTSGSHQRIRPEDILNIKVRIPSIEKAEEFSAIAQGFIDKADKNRGVIQTLSTLRDTLLPKLMSGEVRVAYDNGKA